MDGLHCDHARDGTLRLKPQMTTSELFRADALATQFAIEMKMTKQQAISARILILQNKGASHEQAFDKVLGQGAFDAMASQLFDELNAA